MTTLPDPCLNLPPAEPRQAWDLVTGARQRYGDWRHQHTFGLDVELSGDIELVPVLYAEALAMRGQSALFTSSRPVKNQDGSVTSDSRFSYCSGGRVLEAIHRSPTLLAALRTCTGAPGLRPNQAGYNFYRSGDYLGIHRDAQRAAVTLVVDLRGDLPAMRWSPRHAGVTTGAVLDLARTEGIFPAGHAELPVPHDHLRAFDGHNVPHWRPPFEGTLGVLATFSFSTG